MQCIDEDDQLIYYKVGAERTKKKFKQYRITIKKRENSGETSGYNNRLFYTNIDTNSILIARE